MQCLQSFRFRFLHGHVFCLGYNGYWYLNRLQACLRWCMCLYCRRWLAEAHLELEDGEKSVVWKCAVTSPTVCLTGYGCACCVYPCMHDLFKQEGRQGCGEREAWQNYKRQYLHGASICWVLPLHTTFIDLDLTSRSCGMMQLNLTAFFYGCF